VALLAARESWPILPLVLEEQEERLTTLPFATEAKVSASVPVKRASRLTRCHIQDEERDVLS
jgi:hypothetical protein